MRRLVHLGYALLISSLLASCNLYARSQGSMAWIDAPIDGLSIPIGQSVRLEGHAAGAAGIEYIEVWVDSDLEATIPSPDQVGTLARFSQAWTPPAPGTYTIQMVAYGLDGSVSPPDSITLYVGQVDSKGTPEGTPSFTPENTDVPESITPSPTSTLFIPTATFTPIPPTDPPTEPPPPDTTGPNPPNTISPSGSQMLGCSGGVGLIWSSASDPSGIDGYSVEVERHAGDNNWAVAPGSPLKGLGGTSTSIAVECGWYYRWRVRARDGAGNWGSFSSWAQFAVSLG